MRRFLVPIIILIMASFASITSAQTAASAGCGAVAGTVNTAPLTVSDNFIAGELIVVRVTSDNGGLFDVTIAGVLLLNDAASDSSVNYVVDADAAVTIEVTITGGTGSFVLDCVTEDGSTDQNDGTICHIPPGNPDAAHTITVGSQNAVDAHVRNHGDTLGACPEGTQTRADLPNVNITIFIIFASDSIQVYGGCDDDCQEVMNIPIILIVDLDLVVININSSDDNDDQGEDADESGDDGEFMDVDNPEDFGFVLDEVNQEGMYVVIYYLHPNPDDPTVGVFQINVYDNGTLVDDSILLFITTSGDIVLWTDQGYWDQQLEASFSDS